MQLIRRKALLNPLNLATTSQNSWGPRWSEFKMVLRMRPHMYETLMEDNRMIG